MINSRDGEKGYTLIELIVVMVLISIMLAVSVPRFRTALVSDQLRYSSRRLLGIAQGIRAKAVRDYCDYRLYFDFDEQRVWYSKEVDDGNGEVVSESFRLPVGVRVLDIWSAGAGKRDGGEPFLSWSRKGYAEQAAIHLAEDDGRVVTLLIRPFLTRIQVLDGYQEAAVY